MRRLGICCGDEIDDDDDDDEGYSRMLRRRTSRALFSSGGLVIQPEKEWVWIYIFNCKSMADATYNETAIAPKASIERKRTNVVLH